MFASNVAPRRRVREQKVGYCHSCNIEAKRFHSKCPRCGGELAR